MNIKLIVVLCLGLLLGALAAVATNPAIRSAVFPAMGSQSTGKALIGGPFTLTDHHGKAVTNDTYKGKYRLVFFGFTFCPDICPASLQVISAALDQLGSGADAITPLFISVDPDRDTPQKMAEYVESFSPRIIGLTGTPDEIARAARAYRIYYAKVKNEDFPGDYTIDHSSYYYLMDKKGDFITHFPHSISAEKLSIALKQLF